MTPEERQLLTDLANKIAQTPAQQRDQEAEEFIRTKIGSRPDALYLMTQTVLIQNMAIEHAHQQIEQMQQQVSRGGPPTPQNSPGFLGGGPNRQSTWGMPAAPPNYSQQPGAYNPPPPTYTAVPSSSGTQGGGSGFLRGAAQTAAGVAAGALAFEGIRSLFGGVEHMAGFGGPSGSSFLGGGYGAGSIGAPREETIVNNYYDSPEQQGGDRDQDTSDQDNTYQADDVSDDAQYDDSSDYGGDDSSGDTDLV